MLRCHAPAAATIPSLMLFHGTLRRSYPLGPLIPDLPDFLQPGTLRALPVRAGNCEELAHKTVLPPQG